MKKSTNKRRKRREDKTQKRARAGARLEEHVYRDVYKDSSRGQSAGGERRGANPSCLALSSHLCSVLTVRNFYFRAPLVRLPTLRQNHHCSHQPCYSFRLPLRTRRPSRSDLVLSQSFHVVPTRPVGHQQSLRSDGRRHCRHLLGGWLKLIVFVFGHGSVEQNGQRRGCCWQRRAFFVA